MLGPLVGGLLTDRVSWRWCFWINLPTGGIAAVVLFFFLNLNPTKKRPARDVLRTFDFLGLFGVIAGVALLLLGFQFSQSALKGWSAPETITPLVLGVVIIIAVSVYELKTKKKEPILPPRLFRTRTTTAILLATFLHAFLFFGASYYVPLYFQILGSSATGAGLRQLPLSAGSALSTGLSGVVISKMGKYRPAMWFGWTSMTIGFVSLYLRDLRTELTKERLRDFYRA